VIVPVVAVVVAVVVVVGGSSGGGSGCFGEFHVVLGVFRWITEAKQRRRRKFG